jgi:hypothetical protein
MAQVQQPFSSVQVNINEIKDEELKMKIEFEMSKYDDCRRAQTEAANQVVLAGAALLAAQSARAISRIKLVRLFGEGSDKVAMEPNLSGRTVGRRSRTSCLSGISATSSVPSVSR